MAIYLFVGRQRQDVLDAANTFAANNPNADLSLEETDAFACDADNGDSVALDGNPKVYVARVDF